MSFALLRRFFRLGLVAFLWAGSPLHAEPIQESSIWVAELSNKPTELAARLRPRLQEDYCGRNVFKLPETRKPRRPARRAEWSWLVCLGSLLERWDGPRVRLPEWSAHRLPDLTAELRNARLASKDTDDILVDFVLRNASDRDIFIFERWNSWGAHQWEVELRDTSGAVRILVNQEMIWFANFPSTLAILAGSEVVTECHLESPGFHPKGRTAPNDAFSERMFPPVLWRFPVHLRGRFGAEGHEDVGPFELWDGTPNWSGMIWSDEITVER